MITLKEYWMGRDVQFAAELTDEVISNAMNTVERANKLLEAFGEARGVTSGWRPVAVNRATPNAALRSKHMSGQAVDLADPDGDLDDWALENPDVLESCGLWQEHPSATKGWAHFQIVPPKSGKRVFYP